MTLQPASGSSEAPLLPAVPASVPSPREVPQFIGQPTMVSWTQPFAASQQSCVHASASSQLPHAVHAVAPATLVNEPAGHAVQVVMAVVVHAVAWNVPASQTLHSLHAPPLR